MNTYRHKVYCSTQIPVHIHTCTPRLCRRILVVGKMQNCIYPWKTLKFKKMFTGYVTLQCTHHSTMVLSSFKMNMWLLHFSSMRSYSRNTDCVRQKHTLGFSSPRKQWSIIRGQVYIHYFKGNFATKWNLFHSILLTRSWDITIWLKRSK